MLRYRHTWLLLLGMFFSGILLHAQIISTIAGNGSSIASGDGGPATAAGIGLPDCIYISPTGNIYVSISRVRKIATDGIITNFAGGGTGPDGSPATAALLGGALGISEDASGNIYVVSNNTIRMINTAGIISTFAGTGTMAYTGDGGPATAADLFGPTNITNDHLGNFYITHVTHIRKINTAGIISTIAGTGTSGYSGDGGPATAAQMNGAREILVDGAGNLLFTDRLNSVVRKISPSGIIETIAGTGVYGFSGDGGPASSAQLAYPAGLALDPWGNLYIADQLNNRIRMINPLGTISTIAGNGVPVFAGDGGPATAASLNRPYYISASPTGDLYITDRQNSRIRKVSTYNRPPAFISGSVALLIACGEYNNTDTLLAVMDTNSTQPLTWSLAQPPAHGTVALSYTTTSTGGIVYPSGTGYTPAAGYSGPDTFSVRIFDGGAADTIIVAVDVQTFPIASPISGPDTICIGDTTLFSAGSMGVWSASGASVSATGGVSATATGTATITYTVSNFCGTDYSTHNVTILPAGECPVAVRNVAGTQGILIYPNPSNGTFTIFLPKSGDAQIVITDVAGRAVKTVSTEGSTTMQLREPPGIYLLTATTFSDVIREKLIVR